MLVVEIETTPKLVSNVYEKLKENISKYRDVVGRPLTLTEKILSGHLHRYYRDHRILRQPLSSRS